MLPAQPNQSLIDGLACLQAVISHPEPIGSRELARLLDLEPTRANRLLKTLGHLGLVRQDARRKYGPGPGLHVLAAQALFGSGLLRRALRPLATLHELGHIVALGVLWRDQVSYLYHAEARMRPDEGIGRVRLYPASRSAIGMPLLAAQTDAEVRALYRRAPEIPGFPGGLPELLAALARVRRAGYAYVLQSRTTGVYSLGITIGTPPYAAVALSGRIGRGDIPPLLARLRHAARAVEGNGAAGP